jgi:maltose alpha-D-glucosyltransferase / alpha-amylase
MMFNFYVNQHVFYALASGDAAPLITALEKTRSIPPFTQWALVTSASTLKGSGAIPTRF